MKRAMPLAQLNKKEKIRENLCNLVVNNKEIVY